MSKAILKRWIGSSVKKTVTMGTVSQARVQMEDLMTEIAALPKPK